MKKMFAFLLSILLIVPCIAGASATQRRGLIEYVELFMKRISGFEQGSGHDLDIRPLSGNYIGEQKDGLISLSTSAGSVTIYADDFSVHDVMITLATNIDNEASRQKKTVIAAMAISALEFNSEDESILKITGKDVIDESLSVFKEKIYAYYNFSLETAKATDSKIKIYSGNYDYFIRYMVVDGTECVFLIAEEHE